MSFELEVLKLMFKIEIRSRIMILTLLRRQKRV